MIFKEIFRHSVITLPLVAACMAGSAVSAQETVGYEAEVVLNAGSGDFAPYYIASNRHGLLTQSSDALLRLEAVRSLDLSRRFSYAYGAEVVAGYADKVDYLCYDPASETFRAHGEGPSAISLRQLYGEVKYRGVFLTVGMKQHESALLDFSLSSGDLVESGNARPVPEVRVGFVDFQDIPFTDGWVQIQGEIAYGKFVDNGWLKDHYNYYDWHINLGSLYHYKRCYFRTNPDQPVSVTVGMQTSGQFGGITHVYANGVETKQYTGRTSFKDFINMFIPRQQSGSRFYDGNSLGSWDVMARYRFNSGAQIKAYVQKPWEDGSGIGWMNGFDGLWGLEYAASQTDAVINGAVIEYIDFTNQSGPIHWSPGDSPGTTITSNATGADAYYNNFQYNSYMNYGMSLGTPFLPAPIYNTDGYMAYVDTRVRGFHAGVSGRIGNVDYRILGGYRKGWGDGKAPTATTHHDTSVMVEGAYTVPSLPAMRVKAQVGFDSGNMFGDNFGACLTVAYRGSLNFGKK
ncbi:MAG: capsule assembly Wzi family protein [Muribaculaceae bacterium]|nr:capsule assembly Wzi family protein [Muribaculaceae bacterium]